VKKKNILKKETQEEEYKFCDDPQKERYFTRHQSEIFSKQLENERTNPSSVESNKNQMSTTLSLKQKWNSKRRRIHFEEKEAFSDHPENCQCAIDTREEYGFKSDYIFDPTLQPKKTNLKKKSKYGKFIVENVHPSFIHDTLAYKVNYVKAGIRFDESTHMYKFLSNSEWVKN
jgi:hypothetical protein